VGWFITCSTAANDRLRLFKKDDDYAAFERVLAEASERCAGGPGTAFPPGR
jgi:hypothetical protein